LSDIHGFFDSCPTLITTINMKDNINTRGDGYGGYLLKRFNNQQHEGITPSSMMRQQQHHCPLSCNETPPPIAM
jgi:hypothetical protein